MNLPVPGCKLCIIMTAAMVFGLATQAQRAISSGEKIQFSEPSNPLAISNLNNLSAAGQSTSRKLQDDLSRSSGLGEQALSPSIALPQPSLNPVIQNQRSREQDRNKNWIFRELNDLSSDDPLKERLGLWQTGAKEKKALSPMERYFETSDRKGEKSEKSANPWSENADAGKDGDFTSPNVLNSSGAKLTPTEKMYRSFNGPDLSDNPFVPPGASGSGAAEGFSNFGAPMGHPFRTPDQQKRMDEFQEILTGHSMTTPASTLNANTLRPSTVGSADYRSALNPAILGDINSGLNFHSHAFEDPGARVFGSPSPAKTVEKPKSWVEPQLQTLPQRKF
ncbi:MAG TPA: hypothetical protein VH598_03995 [Verrucomicrobiae bacterium]|nr:hypothetical protein [Verrucomicrobiae bacterium]